MGFRHSTTLGSCTTAVCNPSFDAATNRFASGQSYTYDANGAITVESTGMQYTLDGENRQIEVKNASNVSLAEYSYDGEGKRVRKVATGSSASVVTHFVYDAGGTLIEEWETTVPLEKGGQPTVTTTSYIYAGSRLISTETSSGTTYVTLDHLGSTRVTTDGSGNITSRKDFMSFGEEAISAQRTGGLGYAAPPIRKDYTGYEKEVESGLQFAQARFQNPVHGRFTSVDPLMASATPTDPQTFNRYSYVMNKPMTLIDPSGLRSCFSAECSGSDDESWGPSMSDGAKRNADRWESIMADGYDPVLDKFQGEVTINYNTGACGQGVSAICGGSTTLYQPSLGDVESAVGRARNTVLSQQAWVSQKISRNKVEDKLGSTGLGTLISNRTPQKVGFKFTVNPLDRDKFDDFIESNFGPSGGGIFWVMHKEDLGGCGEGSDCRDYRTRKGSMGITGSMQVAFDLNSGRGYVDIDRFNPYQFPGGTFGHLFFDVLGGGPSVTQTGTNLRNLATLRDRYRR